METQFAHASTGLVRADLAHKKRRLAALTGEIAALEQLLTTRGTPTKENPMPTSKPTPKDPEFLTVAEVAARMRLSRMTVYRMVHSGQLASVRPSARTIRIPAASVAAYLKAAEYTPEAAA